MVFGSVKVKKFAKAPLSTCLRGGIFVANSSHGAAGLYRSCIVRRELHDGGGGRILRNGQLVLFMYRRW